MTAERSITLPASKGPDRVGQATAVEQSRAVAEVVAAVTSAQRLPRDVARSVAAMRESCSQKALAERAFFRFPRGASTVSGPSIHLARELARCWGNMQYGIAELRRDDEHGQSEMQAFAWDVETNSRTTTTFVVPHKRDTTRGVQALTDMRDIYENNANNGARRVREMVYAILPTWFVEEAKDLCNATLNADVSEKPLAQRIADAVKGFADRYGVTVDQLVAKVGRPVKDWTVEDITMLNVIARSLRNGEVNVDEEFEPRRTTTADVTLARARKAAAEPAAKTTERPAPQSVVEPVIVEDPPGDGTLDWPDVAKPADGAE